MADAPLLTPSEVDAHLWTLQRGGHLTQGTYIAALHTLRAAWGERDIVQGVSDGWRALAIRLERERDAARAALRECEWADQWDGWNHCPLCQEKQRKGHSPDCALRDALGEPAGQETP